MGTQTDAMYIYEIGVRETPDERGHHIWSITKRHKVFDTREVLACGYGNTVEEAFQYALDYYNNNIKGDNK